MGIFRFKQFQIDDTDCAMKTGTDGVLLGAWASPGAGSRVIDAGCGSGLISLMLAQRDDSLLITSVEIDSPAAETARLNVANSPWAERIEVVNQDILDMEFPSRCHIVSNPPFFVETLRSPDPSRALARHGDTLNVESLIDLAGRLAGSEDQLSGLSFIAPASSLDDILFRLSLNRLAPIRVCEVIPRAGRKPVRVLIEAAPERDVTSPCVYTSLVLRNADGSPGDDYRSLTSDFYLKF